MRREDSKRNLLFIVTIIMMSIYLIWRLVFTLPYHQGALNMIFGLLLYTAEAVTVFTTFELFYQKMHMNRYHLECPEVPAEYYPDVDVFIATHNEPADILYKTVNACTFMEYPDKNKVHIYLCDDGNRKEIAKLAEEFQIGYLGLADNKHAKSGNLNHALSRTNSPLIATFDADMIPQRTFLMKTVPYFLLSRFKKENGGWKLISEGEVNKQFRMGIVQTPQSFYNPDLFQFNLYAEGNIPNEQDFFSKEVNIMRNSSNAVAYTGSNTVISREALEEIGGFPYNTITEDFETSIRIQEAGYITYATDEIQAAGLTTTTVKSMLKQRVRWARGVIQSLQNTKAIVTKRLSLPARITYLNSFLYWWSFFNRLIFILSPILFALFDFKIVNSGFWDVIVFWLPAYIFYSTSMRYLSGYIRNQRWSQVIDTIFMPYLIIPVILETLHIHQRKFKVTNKKRNQNESRFGYILYAIPHMILLILSAAAMIRFVNGKYGWALLYSSIIIFWIAYNMVALFYAIFFMLGRPAYRKSERFMANEKIVVEYKGQEYEAVTVDLSENGVAFRMETPVYLPEQETIHFTVTSDHYKARLCGSIKYVKKDEGEGAWRYSALVEPEDEGSRRQYMQLIYDRVHSLPMEMNLWITAYDDMIRNIKKRFSKTFSDQRKLPRIPVNREIAFSNGATCKVVNFNFNYFSVLNFDANGNEEDQFDYNTEKGIKLTLKRTGKYRQHSVEELLAVTNIDELIEKNQIDQILSEISKTDEGEN